MTKYFTKPIRLVDEEYDYLNDYPMSETITVIEEDTDTPTGILDRYGRELWKTYKTPIGFGNHGR